MPTDRQPAPAPRPASTASHQAAVGSSSLVALNPAPNTDDSPTVITAPPADAGHGPPITAGSKLGHFELIEAIGAGGMAAVLKARDLELGRVVALKILPPSMAKDHENVVRFKQEARAAARLDHDNVARVFFCGEDRGQHFIAFEFVEGDNLRVVIDRRGTIPPGECVRYMAQVAAGLAHAAARGVVHRDVKPSNIIVTLDGKAKLVDMGLARSLGGQSVNGGVTQSGVTLGTFDYISPEQALDPRRADVRSDLYSLGCTVYHALTGRPPVPEGTAAKKLHAHQHDPVTDPRILNPAVPDDLAAVLAKLMAKDPDRRYQTPGDLIADLTVLAARLDVPLDGLPTDASTRAAVGRMTADPPRLPLGWAAAAAGVVVAVAVMAGSNSTGPDWTAVPVPPVERPAPLVRPPDPPPSTPGASVAAVVRPNTAEELAQALANPGVSEVRLTKGKVYDLSALSQGVVIDRSVTVAGVAGPDAPVVRVAVGGADAGPAGHPGTLTVRKGDLVKFEGVRFKLADALGADEQTAAPAGLVVAGAKHVVLDGCWFEAPDLGAASAAGVAVAGPAELTVTHCFFDVRRAVGVRLAGKVNAKISETAFAPHQSAVELEAADDGPGEVRLTHCTFLLDARGAAVRADDGGRWDVTAGGCVFAAPPPSAEADMAMMTTDPGEHRPAAFRVEADRPGADAKFSGRAGEPNAYYRVAPLVAGVGGAARGFTFDDARQFDPVPASDMAAVELTQSPWEWADPLKELSRPDPWRALQLRTTFRRVQLLAPDHLLGARFVPRKDTLEMYNAWPPPKLGADAASPREKVWWPAADGRLGRNEFDSLDQAVAALKPGDTLLIKHEGTLAVPPVAIDRMHSPVTVRPHPESARLVLTPPSGGRSEAGVFRVTDGDLTLEKLEFRGRAAAAVSGGRCALKECVVTLPDDPAGRSAGVVVTDPADGTARRPTVVVENSLIRGRGAGVWVPAARPFDLEVTNSVVAVAGPLVGIGAPTRPATDDPARVTLTRVTAVLAGPVFDLQPGRGTWVPVAVTAGRCVFSAPDPKRPAPVVTVAPAADPADPTKYLKWTPAGGPNWYDRPADAAFLELVPADDAVEPTTEAAAGWLAFAGEKSSAVGTVGFRSPPPAVADLAGVTADRLQVTNGVPGSDPGDAGADAARVAHPTDDPRGQP